MDYNVSSFFDGVRSVGLFGIGRSNLEVAGLLPSGVKVILRSEEHISRETLPRRLRHAPVFCGSDAFININEDLLFLSPSVRRDKKELLAALHRGVRFCSDLELFLRLFKGRIFSVSGSDGKSTTASLCAMLLSHSFCDSAAVGNVGLPFCRALGNSCATLELSSFSLLYSVPCSLRAAITNITPNHLNWHKDFEEYKRAKLSLLDNCLEAVVCADDRILADYAKCNGAFAVVSTELSLFDLAREYDAELYFTLDGGAVCKNGKPVISVRDILRNEKHNIKNLMQALAMAEGYTCTEKIKEVAGSFGGLDHRGELFLENGGIKFVDSSIDTTPSRTITTLCSTFGEVILILGGRGKGCSYAPLRDYMSRVKLVVIYGEDRHRIKQDLCGSVEICVIEGFEDCVLYSASVAKAGDTVLLSPAATSYDCFESFEFRGREFKRIVTDFYKKQEK